MLYMKYLNEFAMDWSQLLSDRSPVIGFVQIAVFLIGLAIICVGGYISLASLWNGEQKSIIADIGFFGIGTQPWPQTPYFGPWQAVGVIIGEFWIAIGFLMVIPYKRHRD